jgi:ABC-type lipoprotein export system ATPase subunit
MPDRLTFKLQLSRPASTSLTPSPNVLAVAGMFGLSLDPPPSDRSRPGAATPELTIIPPTTLTLRGGQVVFITGPSGGGKSSLLHLIHAALNAADPPVRTLRLDPGAIQNVPDLPLIDTFPPPLENALALLSLAGLSDAFVLLRRPSELSDGQRYRFALAHALSQIPPAPAPGIPGTSRTSGNVSACHGEDPNHAGPSAPEVPLTVLLADEFGATLDRLTAAVLARNLRRWTRRQAGVVFVAATTHEDLLEPLEPDILIEKHLGSTLTLLER